MEKREWSLGDTSSFAESRKQGEEANRQDVVLGGLH